MKNIIVLILSFYLILGCKNNEKDKLKVNIKLGFSLEKVVVINNYENSVTYFKVKITNQSNSTIILKDNNLTERLTPENTGFYLKNSKNNSLISLGIDNYYFYEIGPKVSGYRFIGTDDIKKACYIKDSLKLRKIITNSLLEYNGKNFNLSKIKKSRYINNTRFENFIKNRDNYIPYKDSISIRIPEKIEIKYINGMPVLQEEWDKL